MSTCDTYPVTQESIDVLVGLSEKLLEMSRILFIGLQASDRSPVCLAAMHNAQDLLKEVAVLQKRAVALLASTSEEQTHHLRIVDASLTKV